MRVLFCGSVEKTFLQANDGRTRGGTCCYGQDEPLGPTDENGAREHREAGQMARYALSADKQSPVSSDPSSPAQVGACPLTSYTA